MGSGKYLKRSIEKYGIEHFEKEIIEVYDQEWKMNLAEKILVVIDKEISYNLCSGGKGGFGYINSLSLNNSNKNKTEIYKKISTKLSGRKFPNMSKSLKSSHTKGLRTKIYFGNRGNIDVLALKKSLLPETIEKRKLTYKKNNHQQGSKNSQFGKCWITNGTENTRINKEEIDFLETGWYKGRTPKKANLC